MAKKSVRPNEGYLHEALDRIHSIQVMIDELIVQHPVYEYFEFVKERVNMAGMLLNDAYQKVGHLMSLENKDNCEVCHGARGGVKGNENRITVGAEGYILMCDYCDAKYSKKRKE